MIAQWTRKKPLTLFQELRLRRHFKVYAELYGINKTCNCNKCKDRRICALSFDLYNSDGDCLYEK